MIISNQKCGSSCCFASISHRRYPGNNIAGRFKTMVTRYECSHTLLCGLLFQSSFVQHYSRICFLFLLSTLTILASSSMAAATQNCHVGAGNNTNYQRYFQGMRAMYSHVDSVESTCLPVHEQCGWPSRDNSKGLPLFVLSVGLEGAGHHLWTEILQKPVFDCVWINGRHYNRDLADGVPRTTLESAHSGFKDMFEMRLKGGQKACRTIYDAEDSFPTGAIRKSGRVFMRPDLINIQAMDGVLFDVKYLIILRNTTVFTQLLIVE
jgi:hypothetical protein